MIKIDKSKCINCLICYDVCPDYVFEVNTGENGKKNLELCFPLQCCGCGHCIALCKPGALSHDDLPLDQFVEMKGENPSAESLEYLIMTRRSIRKYKDKQVPKEVIERLLDAAVHAGTASNSQSEQFVVLQDKQKIQALERMVVETLWNAGLKYLGKDGLMKKLLEKKYGSKLVNQFSSYYHIVANRRKNNELQGMIFRNAPAVIIAAGPKTNTLTRTNCALAFRNMELLARTMNLGSCLIGFIVAAAEKSKKIDRFLDLPKDYTVGGCIILGYPVYDYTVKIPRVKRTITWL